MYYNDQVRYAAMRRFPVLQTGSTGHELDSQVDCFINELDDEAYQSVLDEIDDQDEDEAASIKIKMVLAFLLGLIGSSMIWGLR